ncbi:DEKNAAC104358 [Brettanomyces naardenensis]|uniref:DEKNAAC104358 n=1 Tax=Brettanomyces naardenensis TaxID=13370 RepID=A0A448YQS4_BRENA|nr:DEKNAAC104358 [Brettanomyces naardenensis]
MARKGAKGVTKNSKSVGSRRSKVEKVEKVKEVEKKEDVNELDKDEIKLLDSEESESEEDVDEEAEVAEELEEDEDVQEDVQEDEDEPEQEESEEPEEQEQSENPQVPDAIVPVNIHTINKPKLQSKKQKGSKNEKKGVIYVGRIPHGFYEAELRKYFSQFGEITRLRLSRNKKTGQSKHYAFIEFSSNEVAKIAAETMNNYLLFSHLLRCSVIPPEKIHDELFNGANTKFKPLPWVKISQRENDKPKTRDHWKALEKKAENSLKEKQKKLTDAGIDFDLSELRS